MTNFTVLSWNIFGGSGAPKSHLDIISKAKNYFVGTRNDKGVILKMGDEIKKYSPDFVALQEVDYGSKRNGGFNQVNSFRYHLNMLNFHFVKEKGGYYNDGNALLSKHPFTNIDVVPMVSRLEDRYLLIADSYIGDKKLTIAVTHLTAFGFNSSVRQKQVEHICDVIEKINNPVVLMADFNCQSGYPEFDYLSDYSRLSSVISHNTFPVYNPTLAFDNIFVSKEIDFIESGLVKEKLSDHYGVYAKLSF